MLAAARRDAALFPNYFGQTSLVWMPYKDLYFIYMSVFERPHAKYLYRTIPVHTP